MTHAATTKSKRREADRLRKAAERAARKAAGAPTMTQVDLAVTETISFLIKSEHSLSGKMPDAIKVKDIVSLATAILVKRWRLDRAECKKALVARLGPRPEHEWPHYFPRLPKKPSAPPADTSRVNTANTPVTHTGQVLRSKPEVTEI